MHWKLSIHKLEDTPVQCSSKQLHCSGPLLAKHRSISPRYAGTRRLTARLWHCVKPKRSSKWQEAPSSNGANTLMRYVSVLSAAAPVAFGLNMEQEIVTDDYIIDLLQHVVCHLTSHQLQCSLLLGIASKRIFFPIISFITVNYFLFLFPTPWTVVV